MLTSKIFKDGIAITTLEDWRTRAGPKDPVGQWKEGRSALELAKTWLTAGEMLPSEVALMFNSHPDFGGIRSWQCEPEVQLRFDGFTGEPRNTDLLVQCEDEHGQFLVAVEGKADEPFDRTLAATMSDALEARVKKPASRRMHRLLQLVEAIVTPGTTTPALANLRYQLFTATAGVLCEAQRQGLQRAVLLIHEFMTPLTSDENHTRNGADLNAFVQRVTSKAIEHIDAGVLYGPITLPGKPLFDPAISLYIGKAMRKMRSEG